MTARAIRAVLAALLVATSAAAVDFCPVLHARAAFAVSGLCRARAGRRCASLTLIDDGGCSLALNAKAAFAASAMATALLHPIDTLKTRLQSDAYTVSPARAPVLRRRRPAPDEPARPRLMTGLYTGLPANVLKEAPDAAVFLMVSEELSRTLAYSSPWFASHLAATLTLMLSGAVGDAAGSVLRLPAEELCNLPQSPPQSPANLPRLQVAAYAEAKQRLQEAALRLHELGSDLGSWSQRANAARCSGVSELAADAVVEGLPLDLLAGVFAGVDLVREQGACTLLRGITCRALYYALPRCRTLYYAPLIGVFFGLYEHFRRVLS
ncbi:hypothetical protein EMIHUDRAFT_112543 [Emiliania huxleyi CCMP1516]|uniref:Uncharacterized protein n=2 Tax=Emiliania huxleyi TaxID=2903 RepID=A0A0D3K7X3_EMIH1|nr:hypothetical protein EMIHUDRAFT_112543 [Emiliania huxleyi CCMP1516]EOD31858.1 hypothetical protein EMIHUDRAFT_112543 [Emiliania huxleyi CCMP1516]|eukprot:XP_005784287.1 hypothetical protein EMIHUDRAFT_112543 [Emiliania huxleyi CCMP1516]